MKLGLEIRIPLAFALTLLLLIVVGGFSYRTMTKLSAGIQMQAQSYEILTRTEEVLKTLVDAETGARGYVITGEESYLEPYHEAQRNFPKQFAQLQEATNKNPEHQHQLDLLERVGKEKFKALAEGIEIRRVQGLKAILDRPAGRGKLLMDQIRAASGAIKEKEKEQLQQRSGTLQSAISRTLLTILLSSVLGILALGLANVTILREIRRRSIAETSLEQANAELEARVRARTVELTEANLALRAEIARREEAEAAGRQQREWWRVTLSSIGDAVITTDSEGRINYINGTAQALTQWTLEEAMGQPLDRVFNIVNEDTHQPAESPIAKVLREGVIVGLANHTALIAKDGSETPIDDSGAPIRDDQGQIIGAVLTFRDVKQHREAEAELRRARNFAQQIIEVTPDALSLFDLRENSHVFSNQNSASRLGMTMEEYNELGPKFLPTLMHPDDWAVFRQLGPKFSELSDGEIEELEYRLRHKDGSWHWFRTRISVFARNDNGQIAQIIGIARDITAHKQNEEERNQLLTSELAARAQAEDANRLKDEFVATISHELRAPLNAILGWARMLRSGTLDPAATAKAVETIERSAENQARLIEDLLDISRIITGKLQMEVRTIDSTAAARAALETVAPAAEAKGIHLISDLEPATSFISGDANRLQQIIWNLLSNAIKFTPKGGTIKMRVARDGSHVTISVSDTGQGIDPGFLPHVFDRFRQADSSSVRKHGGLGLGLAIVRHLVELHGGTVSAHSDGNGRGATFTVRLPIMPLRVPSASSLQTGEWKIRMEVEPILAGLKVLIVDDEEDARQMLAHMLIGYGAKVTAAGSAVEALEILNRQQPDLMISDIGMPDIDGYSLIRRVRELKLGPDGKLPAIALTAYAQTQDRLRALAAGFQHHVPKPVEPAELATVIASLTGRLRA